MYILPKYFSTSTNTLQNILLITTIICDIKWRLWLPYFAPVTGPGTAIYPTATKYNVTVSCEAPQHPSFYALGK